MSITAEKESFGKRAAKWGSAFFLLLCFAAAMGFGDFFRYLLLGLPQGSILALIAVGYSMVYGIILLINFAHGEIFMLSAYLALMCVWGADDFPVRINGFPSFVPLTTAILLIGTATVTFNTFAATTAMFRKKALRLSVGITLGVLVGILSYKAFHSPAWLGAAASLTFAGVVALFAALILRPKPAFQEKGMKLAAFCVGGAVIGGGLSALLMQGQLYWNAVIVSAALTATIGVTLDTVAYKPLRTAPRLIPLITAIGMSIFFSSLAQVIWGPDPHAFPEEGLPELFQQGEFMTEDGEFITDEYLANLPLTEQISLGHAIVVSDPWAPQDSPAYISIPIIDCFIILFGIASMIGLNLLVMKSKLGKSMRACSEDKTTARLVGVNVDAVVAATFVLGSVLAAGVSTLWVIKYKPVEPTMGLIVGILAFASAVLGGIGDIRGAMVGGMVIGLIYNFVPAIENFDTWAIVTQWELISQETAVWIAGMFQGLTQWQLGIAYAFMIAVIIVKPTGLFGEATTKRA